MAGRCCFIIFFLELGAPTSCHSALQIINFIISNITIIIVIVITIFIIIIVVLITTARSEVPGHGGGVGGSDGQRGRQGVAVAFYEAALAAVVRAL